MKYILLGNKEALEQGLVLLNLLTDEQYVHIAEPYVGSSIGQHIRHILDLYFAAFVALNNQDGDVKINYDIRRRGSHVENNRGLAMQEFHQLLRSLRCVDGAMLAKEINVETEVLLSSSKSVSVLSTLSRELIFASSHAVHHFAIIGIAAKLQGVDIPEPFGVAPATASFLRAQSVDDLSDVYD